MLNDTHKLPVRFLAFLLVTAFLLSSCASQAEPQSPSNEDTIPAATQIEESEIEGQPSDEQPAFISHEEARDIAVAYLLDKNTLEAPGEWLAQDQTPENLLGASHFLYTSGAWVVLVKAPVVAPENLVYSIEIDHITSGLRWQGEVDAYGTLKELSLSEAMLVLNPSEARDAAADFIVTNHGWDAPEDWVEQSTEPTENAGVKIIFTSGPWTIQVEYLAAAPIIPEYQVTADHLIYVARWIGTVEASGDIVEGSYLIAE